MTQDETRETVDTTSPWTGEDWAMVHREFIDYAEGGEMAGVHTTRILAALAPHVAAMVAAAERAGAVKMLLTDEERNEVVQALHAREFETEQYLRGLGDPFSGHDACCETAKAKADVFAESRAALQQRLQAINDALAKVGA